MRILVSSFEPFLQAKTNSSLLVSQQLAKDPQNKDVIFVHSIPVRYKSSWESLRNQIEAHRPDFVLALGQSENAKMLTLERFGLNWIESRSQDNDGVIIFNQEIKAGAPLSIKTSTNLEALYDKLHKENIPVQTSVSAGGFLCNYLYYQLLSNKHPSLFVHLPLALEQNETQFENAFKMELKTLCSGVQLILNSLC